MNAEKVLDRHDFEGSDRLREEILLEIRSPGGLYFLARHIFGFTRLNERVHRPLSEWLERNIRDPHALLSIRDPRGSGKTTLCNISLPGWAFLQEDVPGTPIRGLNTRFNIIAPKRDLAAFGSVMTMRDLFEQCETWKALTFDIVVPRKDMWSLTHGLSIQRPEPAGGPNIVPMGMESVMTSTHPNINLTDDPLNERNYNSPTEISKIKDGIIKTHNLTESVGGARLYIGNIWALNDPQDWMRPETEVDGKRIFENVKIWERGMEACKVCLNNRPMDHGETDHEGEIVPVMLDRLENVPATMEDVWRVQHSVDNVMLQAQYYNRPVAPGTLQFDMSNVRSWDWEQGGIESEPTLLIGARVDEAADAIKRGSIYFTRVGSKGMVYERVPTSHLDIYILVDPAPSKEETARHSQFAITVEGCERNGLRQFHLDEYASNAPPQRNLDAILDFYLKWYPFVRKIGIESVAYQATIGDSLLDRARDRKIGTLRESMIEMIPRLASEDAQADRIRYNLMPLFTSGNYYIHRTHRIIQAQGGTFGMAGAKHDLLDALSNLSRVRGAGRKGGRGRESKILVDAALQRLKSVGPTGG